MFQNVHGEDGAEKKMGPIPIRFSQGAAKRKKRNPTSILKNPPRIFLCRHPDVHTKIDRCAVYICVFILTMAVHM